MTTGSLLLVVSLVYGGFFVPVITTVAGAILFGLWFVLPMIGNRHETYR